MLPASAPLHPVAAPPSLAARRSSDAPPSRPPRSSRAARDPGAEPTPSGRRSMSFTPLRVRSHGSLLHGVASPEALIERALMLGYRALALTDRDNLYLSVRFYQRARAEGLSPLLGAELTSPAGHALLLPVDRRGFG